jgi:phosphoglycolate phosphatase
MIPEWKKQATSGKSSAGHALSAAVYVGDTFGDFLATKEAGIEFIHAAYGFGKVPDPDYIINQPADLLKLSNL